MRIKRLSMVAASLVLVGGMTAACGDDNDDEAGQSSTSPASPEAPENPENPETPENPENPETPETPEIPGGDADVAAFCEAAMTAGQAETSGDFASAQEEWSKFYAVGAPDDIPADAAEGFKWYHDLITADGTQEELQQAYAADPEGQAVFAAFTEYVGTTCAAYAG